LRNLAPDVEEDNTRAAAIKTRQIEIKATRTEALVVTGLTLTMKCGSPDNEGGG
jgi:hypothetical protein